MKKLITLTSFAILLIACNENTTKTKTGEVEQPQKIYKEDISDPTNTLSGKIETLQLQYISFGCPCANWIETETYKNLSEDEPLGDKTIFIEQAEQAPELPEYFDLTKHKIVVKGQFYVKPDFPKGTPETEETVAETFNKAPVFRYTELTIKKLK